MYFSESFDRQSVSPVIVRGLCDVWSKIDSSTFVTDEQNAFSLCPPEGPANLVVVRIRGCARNLTCILRVLHLQMSSWTSMSKMWSCVVKDSWKMVDVSQVMITHTIICKIHGSRLTAHVWNAKPNRKILVPEPLTKFNCIIVFYYESRKRELKI